MVCGKIVCDKLCLNMARMVCEKNGMERLCDNDAVK